MSELIDRAVAGAQATKVVLVEDGAVARTGELVARHLPGRAVLVADENTWAAAGQAVTDSLQAAGVALAESIVLRDEPVVRADTEALGRVQDALADLSRSAGKAGDGEGAALVPVCVGSGVLNDLVKRASGQLGLPYAVVGTAGSMDGYTGFGASIAVDGVKTTLPCPAPAVVVLDPLIAVSAPPIMVASGFGDLIAKVPAGADWILADAVGVEPIDPEVWELVQGPLRESLARPAALAAGDTGAYRGLLEGLAMSGLAMQVYDGTRPASGAEHYFSHCWEMEGLGTDRVPPLSHGEKVALGSQAVCAFYDVVLRRDLAALDVDAAVAAYPSWEELEAQVRAAFASYPEAIIENSVRQTREKYLDEAGLREHLTTLTRQWGMLLPRLREQLMTAAEIREILAPVGAPVDPEDIGLTRARLKETYAQARMFRARWTILDLAFEAGWLEEIVEELFAPGGHWHR